MLRLGIQLLCTGTGNGSYARGCASLTLLCAHMLCTDMLCADMLCTDMLCTGTHLLCTGTAMLYSSAILLLPASATPIRSPLLLT